MASGWQGAPYFGTYGQELVSKPAISFKKSCGGVERVCCSCCPFSPHQTGAQKQRVPHQHGSTNISWCMQNPERVLPPTLVEWSSCFVAGDSSCGVSSRSSRMGRGSLLHCCSLTNDRFCTTSRSGRYRIFCR